MKAWFIVLLLEKKHWRPAHRDLKGWGWEVYLQETGFSEQLTADWTQNDVNNKADIKFCIYWVKLISSSSRRLILNYLKTFEAIEQRGRNEWNTRMRKLGYTEQHFPWKNAGVCVQPACGLPETWLQYFLLVWFFLLARACRVGTL